MSEDPFVKTTPHPITRLEEPKEKLLTYKIILSMTPIVWTVQKYVKPTKNDVLEMLAVQIQQHEISDDVFLVFVEEKKEE